MRCGGEGEEGVVMCDQDVVAGVVAVGVGVLVGLG